MYEMFINILQMLVLYAFFLSIWSNIVWNKPTWIFAVSLFIGQFLGFQSDYKQQI